MSCRRRIKEWLWLQRSRLFKPRDYVFCLYHGLPWHVSWNLWGLPIIYQQRRGAITAGPELTLCSLPKYNSIGVFQRVVLKATSPEASIRIGQRVGLSGCTISARLEIVIGDDTLIGSGALIVDNDAHSLHPGERLDKSKIPAAPVRIGKNCFIGARTIILKGVTVGDGAVVGAGTVVTHDVDPYAIVAGNPSKVVGSCR